MTTLLQDLRFAIRLLRRIPGFVLTVVITLGIGLGLNTALFTLFNAYLLRPIAVRDPYSLYQLSATTKGLRNGRNVQRWDYTWDQYQAIRGMPVFSEVLATRGFYARVAERNVEGALVSGNYFAMLGARIARGHAIRRKMRRRRVLRPWSFYPTNSGNLRLRAIPASSAARSRLTPSRSR